MNEVRVLVKEAYGRRAYYPNCETSQNFAKGLKQKSLTDENIEMLKKLGKEIAYYITFGGQTVRILLQ